MEKMAVYDILLLGPPTILKNMKKISLSRQKSIALIAYLADTRCKSTRKKLSSIFWPESEESHSLGALRSVLADVKAKLGSDLLSIEDELIYLKEEYINCDLKQFKEGQKKADNIEDLKKIAELWSGGFLEGFDLKNCPQFSDWKFLEEQIFLGKYKKLLKEISNKLASTELYDDALVYSHKSLVLDNYDEEIHREIITLYALMGNRRAALKQYQNCSHILESELGFPPEPETQDLAEQIRDGSFSNKVFSLNTDVQESLPRVALIPFIIRGPGLLIEPDMGDIIEEAITDYFATSGYVEMISRTSTFSYKNNTKNISRIAAELKADYIIEGFIDLQSHNVIIENRLINASRDSVISIGRETVKFGNTEIIEAAISISNVFLKKLTNCDVSMDSDVLQIVSIKSENSRESKQNDIGLPWRSHGNHLLREYNPDNIDLALKAFNKAIDLNPRDAKAWAGIAHAYSCKGASGMFGSDMDYMHSEAEKAVNMALSIDPEEPTALWVQGEIMTERDWDFEGAGECYRRALKVSPRDPSILSAYSNTLTCQSRFKEALYMAELACEIDPVNGWTLAGKYWALLANKAYRKADLVLDDLEMYFPNEIQNQFSRAFIQLLLGNNDNFISMVEGIQSDLISAGMSRFLGILSYAYAISGREDEAVALIEQLCASLNPHIGLYMPVAATYVGLGEYDLAMDWLDKAAEARDPRLVVLTFIPYYEPLYKFKRYKDFIKRVNLSPEL